MASPILSTAYVPKLFTTGVIIPVIKKSTLDPSVVKNYRPITISSIHTKAIESFIIPLPKYRIINLDSVRTEEPHSHVIYSMMSHLIANLVIVHCF